MLSPEKNEQSQLSSRASADLRVGLNLLGEKGCILLAEYVKAKHEHENAKSQHKHNLTSPKAS